MMGMMLDFYQQEHMWSCPKHSREAIVTAELLPVRATIGHIQMHVIHFCLSDSYLGQLHRTVLRSV